MSEIGKIAKCISCGNEIMPYEIFSDSLHFDKHYCEKCYNFSHEEVECEKCGRKLLRRDLADHFIDYHSEI